MGAPESEKDSSDRERPQHEVTIQPFFMGKYEVTQAQWEAVMGNNPSYFKDSEKAPLSKGGWGDLPVEGVSWNDCQKFCQKLSEKINQKITLPSESQWEYACRAGTTTPFYFGETITTDLANYNGKYTYANEAKGIYRQQTTPLGSFPPNAFGLYDMHGNVWEFCEDNYADNYQNIPTDGSSYINQNLKYVVLRGGSWNFGPDSCRSANRDDIFARLFYSIFGFRVTCVFGRTL